MKTTSASAVIFASAMIFAASPVLAAKIDVEVVELCAATAVLAGYTMSARQLDWPEEKLRQSIKQHTDRRSEPLALALLVAAYEQPVGPTVDDKLTGVLEFHKAVFDRCMDGQTSKINL